MKIFLKLSFLLMLILFSTNLLSQNNKLKKERCVFCIGTKVQKETKTCTNCDYWTNDQRNFNYCSVCRNTRRLFSKYIKCAACDGLGYKPENGYFHNGYFSNAKLTNSKAKVDASKFACIKNSNTKGKNLQQSDTNPDVYIFVDTDGTEFEFWDNGNFAVWDGNNRSIGKWKCKGSNNFDAYIEWKGEKHYFRSETNQWSVTPNAKKIN